MKTIISENKVIVEFDIGEYDKDLINLLSMIEIGKKSKAKDKDIKILADKIVSNWWKLNKEKFLNEDSR